MMSAELQRLVDIDSHFPRIFGPYIAQIIPRLK